MAAGITLNQTLHGYADGHQLLASSLDLQSEEQALMLFMSDLSGPAFRTGFESYLTGYPLQNSGHYCFARTWFAPEMPRPGCVWTHTFLIRGEDVPRIQRLERLNLYFRRPITPEDLRPYQDRFLFHEDPHTAGLSVGSDARPLLAALYGTDRKIVVPSETSNRHEAVSLALYDQQWPRLRRNFRFCTGSLSWRESEFDLSICPPEETHSIGGKGLVVEESRELNRSFEDWVEIAMGDLPTGPGSDYRKFLWQFGSDYADGRAAFRPLTEVFELLDLTAEGEPMGEKMLSAIAHFFPQPEESQRLKSELFGREGRYLAQLGGDLAMAKVLITHPAAMALSEDVAAMRERSIALVSSDMESATNLALLAAQLGGDNAQKYLDAYFDRALSSEDVLRQAPASLLFDILERQPVLLTRPVLWARLDQMGLASRVIGRFSSEPALLMDAISAMMEAGAWNALAGVVEQFGLIALRRVFEIIEGAGGDQIDYPDVLYSILWSRQLVVIGMLERDEVPVVPLKMLTAEIDPRSYSLRGLSLDTWDPLLKTEARFRDERRALMSGLFLLSKGLSGHGRGGVALVADSFDAVYSGAAAKKLDNPLWDRLEPVMAWYSPNWDKCARLIRTVARAFKERDWPARYFVETFQTDEQFLRALDEINELWRGDRYIRRLRNDGRDAGIEWTPSQQSAFRRFI